MWPDKLEKTLKTMPQSESVASTKRSLEDITTRIVELARGEADSRQHVEGRISSIDEMLDSWIRSSSFQGVSYANAFVNPPIGGHIAASFLKDIPYRTDLTPISSLLSAPGEVGSGGESDTEPNAAKSETAAKKKAR